MRSPKNNPLPGRCIGEGVILFFQELPALGHGQGITAVVELVVGVAADPGRMPTCARFHRTRRAARPLAAGGIDMLHQISMVPNLRMIHF